MKRILGRVLMITIPIIAMGGCVNTRGEGEGPLTVSSNVAKGFAAYKKTFKPLAFSITNDGGCHYYLYCPADQGMCQELTDFGYQTKMKCEAACKRPCSVFARADAIVWRGEVSGLDGTAQTIKASAKLEPPSVPDKAAAAKPAEPGYHHRPIAIRWDGYAELLAGTAEIAEKSGVGQIRIVLPNNDGTCTGASAAGGGSSEGVWTVSCTNGLSASGTFKPFGPGKGFERHWQRLTGQGRFVLCRRGGEIEFCVNPSGPPPSLRPAQLP